MGFEYNPNDSGKVFMLGEHNARLTALEEKTEDIAKDVKAILAFMERSKGSWKTLVVLGTAAGTLVEAGHWVAQLFMHKGP